MKRHLFFITVLFLCSLTLFAQNSSDSYDRLVYNLTYLASDILEGRGPGTAGLDSAAVFIARVFKDNGLIPGGDNDTYFQKMDITIGIKLGNNNNLSINGQPVEFKRSFIPLGFSENAHVTGQLIFAGYGIIAREYNYDDFEGIDFNGKIALILCHEPGEEDSASIFDGINETIHSELRSKAINAKTKGAIGVIFVNGPKYHPDDETLPQVHGESGYHSVGIPIVQITQKRMDEILGKGKLAELQNVIEADGNPHSKLLSDFFVEITTELIVKHAEIKNVTSILPGADEEFKESPLIIGAHYDHLGYGGPASRAPGVRAVHNGADDNASGTSTLLEIATVLSKNNKQFKRPIIFIAFTGEEIGLIGSTYFVTHAPFPIKNTIAMLNLDTIGRMVDNKLIVFGAGTAQEWDRIIHGVNHKYKFDLTLQMDGYGPSDQAAFFAKDIPVLHFFTGANIDYHKPSDDTDKINFKDLNRITEFVTELSEYLANREQPLTFSAAGKIKPDMLSRAETATEKKRPWLGTVPDFTYQAGDGLRLNGVSPGSPCEKAGLQAGDIIIQIDDVQIKSIYELMHVLSNRNVGDEIKIIYLRDTIKHSVTTRLADR